MYLRKTCVALPIVTLGLTLTFGGIAANAQGRGLHPHGHGGHRHSQTQRGTGAVWPWYGGVVAVPPYEEPTETYTVPTPTVVVPPPAPLTCHRTVQTVTVPVEGGGTRQITITRC